MDFIDELKQFSKRVDSLKNNLSTEEATKTSIIMPFFALLGYDVFNPEEFVPEYTADVGIKKGEKVDYAILSNGEPVILIECKWVKEELQRHDSQLFRYFGTSKAKFAILTNGIQYRFYTDLEETNKMDETPFLDINILDIKESQINELKKFNKSSFNIQEVFDTASQLKYSTEFKNIFSQELINPSDELVYHFVSNVYSGKKTQAVIEKFKPLVKRSLNQYISEIMNEKIKSALDVQDNKTNDEVVTVKENEIDDKAENKIFTTQDELEAYFIVKNILKSATTLDSIVFKDNERYMAVLLNNKSTKWICRFYFNENRKFFTYPDENKKEIRVNIDNVYDIETYQKELTEVLNRYLVLNNN